MREKSLETSSQQELSTLFADVLDDLQQVSVLLRDHLGDANLSKEIAKIGQCFQKVGADCLTSGLREPTPSSSDGSAEVLRSNSLEDSIRQLLQRTRHGLAAVEHFENHLTRSVDHDELGQCDHALANAEHAILTTILSRKRLASAKLYVLIDNQADEEKFLEQINALVNAGVDLIQLRAKACEDRELVNLGRLLSSTTSGTKTRWIMNDRADLAVVTGADGVHLGQTDLSVADARKIVGAAKMIGVSTHNMEQARLGVMDGANYLGVGPVFESQTKSFDSFAGLEFVKNVAAEIRLPAFAIGGIDTHNLNDVLQAGLSRIAVSSAVINHPEPGKAAAELRSRLNELPER